MATITCPLCEATCGLDVELDGNRVVKVRGDAHDVFSRGFVCPKGGSLGALHHDPDRLRAPLVRRGGALVETTWEAAYAEVARLLEPHLGARDTIAVYAGNPSAHNLATMLYNRVLIKALGSRNVFSASSVDQLPKHVSAGLMFGGAVTIPVPDLDRTRHLLILGANPLASNGSLMTAPDARGRLRAIRERGGKVVVVDPRRSRTAEHADEHHPIRPGTDALLLFALVHTLFAEDLVDAVDHNGVDAVRDAAAAFAPEAVAAATGVAPEAIRRMARELAAAESAAVYGRIGTSTQAFGTLTSWLVDVLNALTGNLDRPGGAMFPLAAAGQLNARPARPFRMGRWHSRVRGLPEAIGELPVAALAEEILEPGSGQVRALVTIGGNPALSTPNGERMTEALASLDALICLDVYVNETTRHADVVLPGPSPLERPHYDLLLYQLAVRNVANFTPAALPSPVPQEWETLLELAAIVSGGEAGAIDDLVAAQLAGGEAPAGRGPERLLDILLRQGPYDLTLDDLRAQPHGVDLGPLRPRLPGVLSTASGKVELAPEPLLADVPRLRAALHAAPGMVLIGRRHLRSNNSWMHNLEPLVKGPERCTAWLHPVDAARLGVTDRVRVASRAGAVELPCEVTDAIMPGVVSIPHGWGHGADGARTAVAAAHPGVNANVLADERLLDAPSGTAVLNGIPVTVQAVASAREPATTPAAASA